MSTHVLKCWPQYFEAMRTGRKTADVRSEADRHFEVQDSITFREWDPVTGKYTGRESFRTVTHVLRGGDFGLMPGHVMLSLDNNTLVRAEVARRQATSMRAEAHRLSVRANDLDSLANLIADSGGPTSPS